MTVSVPTPRIAGRGAQSGAVPTRFGLKTREADGDWLDERAALDEAPPPFRTMVTEEHPKTILGFNRSPDIAFDRSINAYRGCEHGCIYCFARPTHAYLGLSPGLDFETKLFAKPDAPKLLERELSAAGYVPRRIEHVVQMTVALLAHEQAVTLRPAAGMRVSKRRDGVEK